MARKTPAEYQRAYRARQDQKGFVTVTLVVPEHAVKGLQRQALALRDNPALRLSSLRGRGGRFVEWDAG